MMSPALAHATLMKTYTLAEACAAKDTVEVVVAQFAGAKQINPVSLMAANGTAVLVVLGRTEVFFSSNSGEKISAITLSDPNTHVSGYPRHDEFENEKSYLILIDRKTGEFVMDGVTKLRKTDDGFRVVNSHMLPNEALVSENPCQ